ncbi:hypothetical protein L917_04363, partial [Phytophthora nicotianae]
DDRIDIYDDRKTRYVPCDDRIDIYDDRKTRYVPCDDTAHVQPLEQNN